MRRPLLSLSVAFALGILIRDLAPVPGWVAWTVAAVCTLVASGLALARIGGPLRFLVWMFVLLALGSARGILEEVPDPPETAGPVVVQGTADSAWEFHPDRLRLEMSVQGIAEPGGDYIPVVANLLLTVQLEDQGPACPAVLPGDHLRALTKVRLPWSVRNPGVRDYHRLKQRRGIHWTATVRSCEHLLVERSSTGLQREIEGIRMAVRQFINAREGSDRAKGILTALTIGERGLIPHRVQEGFRRAGLAHLLAISGLHLGFVALGLYVLLLKVFVRFRRLVLRLDVRRLAAGLVIPATVLYVLLAGAHLPAVRAGIMVICFLLAVILRRESDPLHTLSAAALIILGLWPQSLFEVSFQLSFAAVAFIILGVPVLASWLRVPLQRSRLDESLFRRVAARVVHFLLVSLVATVGTAPLVVWHFNQLSLVGLLGNLLAVPLGAFLVVPLGLLMVLVLPFSSALAGLLADLALWLSDGLGGLATSMGGWTWACLHPATPTVFELLLMYAILLTTLRLPRRLAKWALAAGLGLLVSSWGLRLISPVLSDQLRVTFIDVGQGDSILVRFPGGKTLLVDGGEGREDGFDAGRQVVAPYLWNQGISRLDYLALSHPQSDHAGGLASIVRLFGPAELWTAEPLGSNPVTQSLARASRESGVRVRVLKASDRPLSGEGFLVEVLWPEGSLEGLEENERSLVLRISYQRHTVLLTGDLEKRGEKGLLSRNVDLTADVLKVGHHGGRGGTTSEFLDRVGPQVAVISVGAGNPHGLPHPELLQRLQDAGIQVLRTDEDGAVEITTSPASIRWRLPLSSSTSSIPSRSMLRAVP